MAGSANRGGARPWRLVALLAGGALLCWIFPLFHVKRVAATPAAGPDTAPVADAKSTADKFWRETLLPAAREADDLGRVVLAVRQNAEGAAKSFGKAAGVGVAYYFLRGSGKVVARERNVLRVAVDGAPNEIIELRTGPVFGNTVRDGSGRLNVNAFPSLQEFNALAAELNALVEARVLPVLREKAQVGMTVHFAGCAEAPESAADPGEPLFTVVPVQAEVR